LPNPLWITYAWVDNTDSDFDYLVQQLESAGISARYDRVALIPGRRLWDQIADQIAKPDLSGWAYLLTPKSVLSEPCKEELAYALDRALRARGSDFPLIGLLHQIPISDVPAALRTRLCVSLNSPDWIEQVRAGLENRPPSRTIPDTAKFKLRPHNSYLGNPDLRAIEIASRFEDIPYWRIAYPAVGPHPVNFGVGPAGGGGIRSVHQSVVHGTVDIGGVPMQFRGAGDAITPSTAAYMVFQNQFPARLYFGNAAEAFANPSLWYPIDVR
jgi:hypothetical protein